MKALNYLLGICIVMIVASCGGNTSAPDNPPSRYHRPGIPDSVHQYATPQDSTTGSGAGANAMYHKTDSTGK